MTENSDFEIFLVTAPGLESFLCDEAEEKGFSRPVAIAGGVTVQGGWPEVWRANLELRGAARILVRIGSFRAMHLAQLDKRSRRLDWGAFLTPGTAVTVEASCKRSRIYHEGAVAQRIKKTLKEEAGAVISPEAEVKLKVRIDDDLCTVSIDSTGDALHKRGHKVAVNKAPMRENMAALFLRQCGFHGQEPVVDPMCGSGTLVIEAAEIAAGMIPGRSRSFAFEKLASFDPAAWKKMKTGQPVREIQDLRFYGFDRDAGAIEMSIANAERAGVAGQTRFAQQVISDLAPPEGAPGLVILNPPYGTRIGDRKQLLPLYQTIGKTLGERFTGWRVGMVTTGEALARATGLPFLPVKGTVANGGLRVSLYQTNPLP